jgi:cell division protein FtsB
MSIDKRNFLRLSQKACAPFLAFVVIGYFIYHSIQGDRGILAWLRLQDRLSTHQQQLTEVTKTRKALEAKISCLRPESLDRDLLDQRVRLQLGYTHPDEIVILTLEEPSQESKEKSQESGK